jgi:hypothetical protein
MSIKKILLTLMVTIKKKKMLNNEKSRYSKDPGWDYPLSIRTEFT